MYWANFLHIYQPPNQKKEILKKIVKESYQKIIQGLKENPRAKLTLNINACLTELLVNNGFKDLVSEIKFLADKGQIELTGSAKYHAFLPLLPENEIKRQIKLNQIANEKYFGKSYSSKGFFPPEMAFSDKVARIVRSFGFDWILADEASLPGEPDYSKIYKIKRMADFKIFFRERETSFKILSAQIASGPMLIADLSERFKKPNYLLTAMDGETFGHHRPGLEKLLFDIYKSEELPTVTISELENYFKETAVCQPMAATWTLMHKDLARNVPFSRWFDPKNKIHQLQWKLTNLAIKAVNSSDGKRARSEKVRTMLDKSLHSDQYWWASAKPWWSLEILEKGAKELKDVVSAASGASSAIKKQAQDLYQKIVFLALDWQREGIVEDLVKEHYDEEVLMRLDTSAPYVPPEEFDKIIEHLRRQMIECAKMEEFEKAAQFRNRIKELETKREEVTKKL